MSRLYKFEMPDGVAQLSFFDSDVEALLWGIEFGAVRVVDYVHGKVVI